MRQKLPESAGYPLAVPGVGLVHPGGPAFDSAEGLVPGCVPAGPEALGKAAEPAQATAKPAEPAGTEDSTENQPAKKARKD